MTIPPLPPLETDPAAIRLRLAGVADSTPDRSFLSTTVTRDMAVRYYTVLAKLFGESLDHLTLWSKLDSSIATALAKIGSSDDVSWFASLCLAGIVADPGRVACCEALEVILETLSHSQADRLAFLSYLRDHRYPVLVFARNRWEQVKKKEVDL